MTITSLVRTLTLVLALSCAAALPAAAQPAAGSGQSMPAHTAAYPPVDLAGGYAFLYDSDNGGAMPAAWLGGLSVGVLPNLSIVGEADGAYSSMSTPAGRRQYRTHAFMAGARLKLGALGDRSPFVQALIGASCYCGSTAQVTGSYSRGLAVQLGGGLDLPLAGPLGVRMQGDYRYVHGDDIGLNQVRLAVSAVVNLTRR